jgi:hypothetical protein
LQIRLFYLLHDDVEDVNEVDDDLFLMTIVFVMVMQTIRMFQTLKRRKVLISAF